MSTIVHWENPTYHWMVNGVTSYYQRAHTCTAEELKDVEAARNKKGTTINIVGMAGRVLSILLEIARRVHIEPRSRMALTCCLIEHL